MAQPTILLVDDEKEIIDMLAIYLKNEGYRLLRASDGAEALQVLQKEEMLAIAKSIVESHEGAIWAEQSSGQIHFFVKLKLV
ncbi:hypothetical protein [Paenibacillus silvestris]|uniref:hypothetical protein n=1 Tax=Paenibacillus silvestris TaxID=2606219 RepID=UPI0038B3A781